MHFARYKTIYYIVSHILTSNRVLNNFKIVVRQLLFLVLNSYSTSNWLLEDRGLLSKYYIIRLLIKISYNLERTGSMVTGRNLPWLSPTKLKALRKIKRNYKNVWHSQCQIPRVKTVNITARAIT